VNSTQTAGNILKGGAPFLHNFGPGNTFLGSNAGNLTMSGYSNTATGMQALSSNTTGFANTASGVFALFNNTIGYSNTASGGDALSSNTTGNNNTASGLAALFRNTTGGNNTASGGSALYSNTAGWYNTASGRSALAGNTTGNSNTASGSDALAHNTTGYGNTALGSGADVSVGNLINATAIGSGALVDASNKIRLGNGAVTVIQGQVAFTFTSDKTTKENFKPVDGEEALGRIRGLNLTSWNYIGHDPKQLRHYGPMAQDFFAAFGDDGIGTIGTPTTINSGDMAGVLMIAAQALEKRTVEQTIATQAQTKRIDALTAENTELKTRLETLERRIGGNALAKTE
jgi:hypothetical protein